MTPVHPSRSTDRVGISHGLLGELLTTAGRAPSLHNSQPWHYRLDEGELELRIDPERALQVCDPEARELVISCGASLYNLRLAVRCQGLVPHVDVARAPADPLLLARISAERGSDPTEGERRMLAATLRRHTHRHAFTSTPLGDSLLRSLAADVASEGAELVWIDEPDQIRAVVELTVLADAYQVGDAPWQAEVTRWVDTAGRERRDGIPRTALPPVPSPRPAHDRLPARTFLPRPAEAGEPTPGAAGRIAVVVSRGDQIGDWLAAGQGLQRMLLRAADVWAFARYATAVLEVPSLRQALRDALGLRDHPQMLLELGHAGCAHITPRLPVAAEQER